MGAKKIANELIEKACIATGIYNELDQEETDKIVRSIYKKALEARVRLAKLASFETGIGVWEHNAIKNTLADKLVYEDIKLGRIIPMTPNSEAIVNRISVIQMQDKVPTLTEKEFITHFRHEIQQTSVLKEFSKIMAYDDS